MEEWGCGLGVGLAVLIPFSVVGLVVLSVNQYRLVHLDLAFGIATTVTGIGLAAAAMVTTVPGASAYMFFGAFWNAVPIIDDRPP